jgi:hypothetical protein
MGDADGGADARFGFDPCEYCIGWEYAVIQKFTFGYIYYIIS